MGCFITNFQRGVIVTPLVRYVVKNTLVGQRFTLLSSIFLQCKSKTKEGLRVLTSHSFNIQFNRTLTITSVFLCFSFLFNFSLFSTTFLSLTAFFRCVFLPHFALSFQWRTIYLLYFKCEPVGTAVSATIVFVLK